jgi:Ni/Fe-hydrogenase subunit HybB-like protein
MLAKAFDLSYESCLFLVEFGLGVVVPMALLAFRKVRENSRGLYAGALFAVLGFVAHRLNVSITGFEGAQGGHYLPSVSEALITLFLVALGFGAFTLAVRYLNIYPAAEEAVVPVTGVASGVAAKADNHAVVPAPLR